MPFIGNYTRRDGTEVQAHSRSAPGSRRQLSIAAIIIILVWGAGEGGIHIKGSATTPPSKPMIRTTVAPAGGGR
ncbi:hypothetical protein [Streptomyces lunalinharesii]|uniref:Uncharacterized protein n=1 Tax=Streptomyces lunalinharesii TaxID=333384 RepID=A0ABN3SXX8_9ACTN